MKTDPKKINNIPFLVPHPGEMLKDELEERGLTQTDFAKIIESQIRTVNEIIKGKRSISPGIARVIGAALGTSPDIWLGMQADYDIFELQKKSKHKEEEVRNRSELYSLFPVSDLIRRHYLPNKRNVDELRQKIFDALGIVSINQFKGKEFAFFRTSQIGDIVENYLRAWVFLGKKKSADLVVKPYNSEGLKTFAFEIKSYSLVGDGIKEVISKLNDLGVRVLFLPHFSRTRVDGSATWISNSEPVIIMSLRFNRIDNFYFTLLHEIGHIVLHSKNNQSFVDDITNPGDNKPEKEADAFAMDALGLKDIIQQLRYRRVDVSTIDERSRELNIHSGLLIGALQHAHILNYNQYRQGLTKIKQTLPLNLQMA